MFGLGHLQLRQSFNARLTMAVLLIAISQFNFGFDQQGFATTQAMDAFDREFGEYDSKKGMWYLPTTWLSFFNGFNYLGQAFGVLLGSWVSKHYGRRWCMFSMSCWALVCATLVITAKTPSHIMVARVMNYIYIGMELAVVPVFQSEITPPKARGFIVGTYQISLMIGGLVMNLIARGTGSIKSDAAYRIPFGLFFIVPTLVAACIWFIPESPRWLALKDRPEDAKASLRLLRDGKFTEEEIDEEFAAIVHAMQQQQHKRGTLRDIFRGTNLRRTMIVCGANFFFQATGQIFTGIYGAIYVKSLGTVNPFSITVAIAVVNVVTAFLAMALLDRAGRRVLILVGASIQLAALMTMGGLGTIKGPSFGIKSGIVAMMVIFNFGYSLGWAPVAHTLSPEIPNLYMRDLTYRTASVLNIITQFTISFSLPYMLNAPYGNLGSKVGFIFGSVAALSIVFAYFCIPNCANLTLEEIDYLFDTHTATRKFQETGRAARNERTIEDSDKEVTLELSERVPKLTREPLHEDS